MYTEVQVRDERKGMWSEFDQIDVGCWFVDEYGNLYCKLIDAYDCENTLSASGSQEEFAPNEFARPIKKLSFIIEE
jgi:hypothetical protein